MNFPAIISQKKFGEALTDAQIAAFVQGAAQHTVPDYQLAALLMAIRLNGMDARETTTLTLEMAKSGDMLHPDVGGVAVDKHSTGGVGDTTTLVLAPLCAACGAKIAKMSGRGLGHTGGTLDKMESIGMRTDLSEEEFLGQVRRVGCAVVGQTAELAPADKTLYALRDTTATVDSLPLIASSIMSKKLASGADAIVLDVKTGSGAIMQTLEDSVKLAQTMVRIGTLAQKPVTAIVTGMDQPLGTHVGNALEVKDALDVLSGRTRGDLLEVSLLLGTHMLLLAGGADSAEHAREKLTHALESGAGLEKFRQMIAHQGGNPAVCDDLSLLPRPAVIRQVPARITGYLAAMDTMALGLAAQGMGAGRIRKTDPLDYSVGFILPVRIGDRLEKDTLLCTLYARDEDSADLAERRIREALTVSDMPVQRPPLWRAQITREGTVYPDVQASDAQSNAQ